MPGSAPNGFTRQYGTDFLTDVPLGTWRGYPVSVLGGTWTAYPSGQPDTAVKMTGRGGVHRPEKVLSISNSMLHIYLHTEAGEHCVAAPRLWPGRDRMLYGHVAFAFRADNLPGYYGVPLWWPTSETWPRDGEMDCFEGGLDRNMAAVMHRQGATSGSDQDWVSTGVPYASGWHIAELFWTPQAARYVLDDRQIMAPMNRIPNTQMRHVLQFETAPGNVPADAVAGYVDIDWYVLDRYGS